MFLTVTDRANIARQLDRLKQDVRHQTFNQRIQKLTNEKQTQEMLKPLIDLGQQNTQILKTCGNRCVFIIAILCFRLRVPQRQHQTAGKRVHWGRENVGCERKSISAN